VTASFQIVIKTISAEKREIKLAELQRQLVERKEKLTYEGRLEYLTRVIGYDVATSKKLILQKQKGR